MSVFDFILSTGVVVPDTDEIRLNVANEFRGVFGDDFITDDTTPGGALITALASARSSIARNNAELANQINPNISGGIFLDALYALTGGERIGASRSLVTGTLTGVSGTIVPAGSIAQTAAGDRFRTAAEATIGVSGSVDVTFESEQTGEIPALAGSLNQIVTNVLGWETVTNAVDATLGSDTESDIEVRRKRLALLGVQGRSQAASVFANVSNVPGVRSVAFRENTESTTQIIDGVTLAANSVWVAVQGGDDTQIASAILESKSGGCGFNGAVSENIVEPSSGQTFSVNFDRFIDVPVQIRITATNPNQVTNFSLLIRDAVLDYAAGDLDGFSGFVGGEDVSPFEIAAAVNTQVDGVFISLVEVTTVAAATFSPQTLIIPIDSIASIASGDITIVVTA